jgi:hypothetical protein
MAVNPGNRMKYSRLFSLVSIVSIFTAGCASVSTAPAPITVPPAETPRSAAAVPAPAPAPKPSCKSLSEIANTVTPPDLYDDMVQCAKQSQYEKGASLFALAGTYTFYDALRVEDASAHRAHGLLLQESLNSLDIARKNALKGEIKKTLGSAEKLTAACAEVSRIGPPAYYPGYMVRYGKNGAAEAKSGAGLIGNVDSKANWETALTKFLHCPGL